MPAQTARAPTAQPPILLQENVGSIRVLTLNRPTARNSLSEGLIAELHGALKQIHDDNSVRAVVIAANGPAFSAGHDMKELTARRSDADRGRAYFGQIMNACSAMMLAVVHLPKPVVAAVQGIATAAGCQLVAGSDLAVATENARFATSGINVGLFCSTPAVPLTRAVPAKAAFEMLITGDFIDANEAQRIGLINHVVPEMSLDDAVAELADKIIAKSPVAVATGKRLFHSLYDRDLERAYAVAAEAMVSNMSAEDVGEGIDAFIAKRQPVWRGR